MSAEIEGALARSARRADCSMSVRLAALREQVDALTGIDLTALDGPAATELFGELQAIGDRLAGLAVRALPVIESDGRWALDGAQSFPRWLAARSGMSVATARREVHLGRTLQDDLPATASAVVTGSLPLGHARVLATVAATSTVRRQALAETGSPCNESFLLTQAAMLGADQFRRLTSRWAAAADPDADDRGFSDASEREYLDVSRTLGGYHLAGFLTEEHGTVLATALASVTGAPAAGDARTSSQRRAHGLVALARLTLDHGLTGTGAAVRPHVSVHVDLERLANVQLHAVARGHLTEEGRPPVVNGPTGPSGLRLGEASFDDGTPVPQQVLARLTCDAEVTRIVFGPGPTVLDVGRSRRTVTGQLRRGVIARDRHCRYPGCDSPPALSEVHHPHHWTDGGVTSINNSVLLCWHHHDWVHRKRIALHHDGGAWIFVDRDGREIRA